jgi:hypothetical protein
MKPHEQLSLFTKRLKTSHLIAKDSPRIAFYKIWIERTDDDYRIVKESGVKGRVLDRRSWPAETLEEAQTLFDRRVNAKTNPLRKSPRKYTRVNEN